MLVQFLAMWAIILVVFLIEQNKQWKKNLEEMEKAGVIYTK